jgi:flavodoxin
MSKYRISETLQCYKKAADIIYEEKKNALQKVSVNESSLIYDELVNFSELVMNQSKDQKGFKRLDKMKIKQAVELSKKLNTPFVGNEDEQAV